MKSAPLLPKDYVMIVGLSGRGDKDVETLTKYFNKE